MKRKSVIILIVIFVIGFASGMFTDKMIEKRRLSFSPQPPSGFLSEYLALSKSQKDKINAIHRILYVKIAELRTELSQKRRELYKLLKNPEQNTEEINQKIDEIASLQKDIQRESMNNLREMRKVLTKEQQDKFFSLIKRRLNNRGERWERMLGKMKGRKGW